MILLILQILAGISLAVFLAARIFSIPHLKILRDFQEETGKKFWVALTLRRTDKSVSASKLVKMYYLSLNCLFTSDIIILIGLLMPALKWVNNLLGVVLIRGDYLDLFSSITLPIGILIGWVSAVCTNQIGSFIGWCIFDLKQPRWIIWKLYTKFFFLS